jgi:glycosyltransferase involved in cell wall biosynthesis
VVLPGRVPADAVDAFIADARVVAIPSISREGLPTVALEAAARGRPLVVSDDPGLAWFVSSTGAGEVVPVGDVGALADALDRCLSDPSLAAERGAAGRHAVEAHSTARGIAALRRIYSGTAGA